MVFTYYGGFTKYFYNDAQVSERVGQPAKSFENLEKFHFFIFKKITNFIFLKFHFRHWLGVQVVTPSMPHATIQHMMVFAIFPPLFMLNFTILLLLHISKFTISSNLINIIFFY